MPRFKKSRPLGVCTVCKAITDQRVHINSRCNKVVVGRRCSGVYRSGLGQLWTECDGCKGYGKLGSISCGECQGYGWKVT